MTLDESCCTNSTEPSPRKERHIPESRIALNPVVIDDSKRGSLAPKPLDEHSLITRLMEWEMKEHIAAKKHHGFTKGLEHASMEKAYSRVIRIIQEGRGVRK